LAAFFVLYKCCSRKQIHSLSGLRLAGGGVLMEKTGFEMVYVFAGINISIKNSMKRPETLCFAQTLNNLNLSFSEL